jgi:hypothetical protein
MRYSTADIDTSAERARLPCMVEEPDTRDAAVPIHEYRMSTCATPEEGRRAASLRRRLFLSRSGLSFDEENERERDEGAVLLGLLRKNGEPVSTVRSVPFPSSFSTLSEIGISNSEADSEAGRLAATPGAHSTVHALLMLTLGALWIERNSVYRTFIAYSHPKLTPLYLAMGAYDTGQTCLIPGRDSTYNIVVGSYEESARIGLKSLGIARRDALKVIPGLR